MHRIATPLLVSTLAATALAAPTAATAAPQQLPPPQLGTIEIPADAKQYTDLGNVFWRSGHLAADGRVSWLFSRQRTSDDGRGLGVVSADLLASDGAPSRVGLRYSTIEGTTALRGNISNYGSASAPQVTATLGGTWFMDRRLTPRPARTQVVRFDDRGRADHRLAVPKDVSLLLLVPTARGLRGVGVRQVKVGRAEGRTESRIVVSGPGLRRWALDPYLRTNDYGRVFAAPLADGSLLLSGASRAGLPEPVLRVSTVGKISRLADRRAPGATQNTTLAGVAPTRLGVVMVETSDSSTLPAADLKTAFVVRGNRGQVVARKLVRDADLGLPETCRRDGSLREFTKVTAGPDGLPVVEVRCSYADTSNYSYKSISTQSLVGLAEDLTGRWVQDLSPVTQDLSGYVPSCEGTRFVGVDQRLWTVGCDGRYGATTVPGLGAASLGTITTSKRDGKAGAVVRIRCEGAYGSVCSGDAVVTIAGKVNAKVPYVLPARPGKAASTLDRHIPTSAPLEGRFRTDLRPRS